MSQSPSASGIAEGDIYPCRILKIGAAEGGLLQASASTDKPIGISFNGTRRSEYIDTSGKLAASGEPLSYYRNGARCKLELGTGGATVGDLLEADSSGKGVTNSVDKKFATAVALQTGVAGDLIDVEVRIGERST